MATLLIALIKEKKFDVLRFKKETEHIGTGAYWRLFVHIHFFF